jgi:Zinc-finger of C2H2 type
VSFVVHLAILTFGRTLHNTYATASVKYDREKKGRYCKVCKLECNSLVVFANHLKSRGHLYRSGLTPTLPRCDVCNRNFPDKAQLDHHKRGRAHCSITKT